ncbi:hypothetical protein, partial [Xenorhabdus hominickii]|uniref:hypothetical protein n=1 Tax=Xenorhabdus hominickii TaxID=351679 RepID=UPI00237A7AE3
MTFAIHPCHRQVKRPIVDMPFYTAGICPCGQVAVAIMAEALPAVVGALAEGDAVMTVIFPAPLCPAARFKVMQPILTVIPQRQAAVLFVEQGRQPVMGIVFLRAPAPVVV